MGSRLGKQDALSVEEVEKHNTKDDAWLILFGEAIDVTKFIPLHPGGEESIAAYLGKDATEDWQMIHPPNAMDRYADSLTRKGKMAANGGLMSWLFSKLSTPGGAYAGGKPAPSTAEPTATGEPVPQAVEPVRWSAEHEGELPPGGNFDINELTRWDGVSLPMCIALCGIVVDVSSSENFVPDFGYGKLWAGKDCTWAMATVSLKEHDAGRFDFTLEDLAPENFKALAGWYKHFKGKYRQVGTLREWQGRDFSSVVKAAEELPVAGMSQ